MRPLFLRTLVFSFVAVLLTGLVYKRTLIDSSFGTMKVRPQYPLGQRPSTDLPGDESTDRKPAPIKPKPENPPLRSLPQLPVPSPLPDHIQPFSAQTKMECGPDLAHLATLCQRYDLSEKLQYLKRYVVFSRPNTTSAHFNSDHGFLSSSQSATGGSSSEQVNILQQAFLPAGGFATVNLGSAKSAGGTKECPAPLQLAVSASPLPTTANLGDIIFGITTTYERLTSEEFKPAVDWTHWLTDGRGHSNGAKLVVTIVDASNEEIVTLQKQLRATGIDVDLLRSESALPLAHRYLNLVGLLYQHKARASRRWIALCDDDTFFPSPNKLMTQLSALDINVHQYIGKLSEDIFSVLRHGSEAFGGAGVFISMPMARMISSRIGACTSSDAIERSNSGWGPQGDLLLRNCIYEHTDVRMTSIPELWQLDLSGDAAGFFERGGQPLSLHHFRGGQWFRAKPYQTTRIGLTCGEACPWQRYIFARDNFVLTNGYSLALYPHGVGGINWEQVERTFKPAGRDEGYNFDYSFGVQRASLHASGHKVAWELQEATVSVEDGGAVVQVYVRRNDDPRWVTPGGHHKPMYDIDGIIEVVWIPDEQSV